MLSAAQSWFHTVFVIPPVTAVTRPSISHKRTSSFIAKPGWLQDDGKKKELKSHREVGQRVFAEDSQYWKAALDDLKKKKIEFCDVSSESSASYFIMVVHNHRGGCWCYGSRGRTFLSIFCYILFLHDRWQQRSSLTEWHLTWNCIWSKGVSLNSPMWKKWQQPAVTIAQKTICVLGGRAQMSHHKT